MAGPKFSCNFEKTKIKYYRASNAILAKLGKQNNATVTVHLLQSMAFPILAYALEALRLNKTKLLKLEHPWSRAFMKIFNTFDNRCGSTIGDAVDASPTSYAVDFLLPE